MASSHRKKMIRLTSVVLSFAILVLVAMTFFQLTHKTNLLLAQAEPTLRLDRTVLTVAESVGTANLNVILENPPTYPVTVTVVTVGSGSAVAGLDYTAVNQVLTFTVGGSTTQQIGVSIINDSLVENTESFLIQLTTPKTVSVTLGTPLVAAINITDNDSGVPTSTPIFGDQYENNNSFAEATEIVAPETGNQATQLCTLTFYPPGDQDYFRWWGKAGVTYIVSTSQLSAGLDTVLDVYNSSQALIASNDDVAPGIFRSEVRITASADGYYFARTTNKSPVDPVNKTYCLNLATDVADTPTPPPATPAGADMCEFNSTIETACLLIAGLSKDNQNFLPTFGSTQDTDIYKLWVKPGIYYTCETTIPEGSAADTNMILWDNNGNSFNPWLGNDDKGTLDFGSRVNYLSTYTGWLFIVVGPVNVPPLDEAADHKYNIECRAAATPPTLTPSPTSAFTGGGGGTFSTATPQPTAELPTPFPTPTPIDFSQFFTPTPAPPPVVQFQPLPTSTPAGGSTQSATIHVTLYYDTNNNFLPELTEGIVNAAVALYDHGTGELIAFGHTNETGVARFTAVNAAGAVRVVVPFLSYSQVVVGDDAEILVRVAPQPLPIGIP